MSKKYLTPSELNTRLAETRDQKFRHQTQARIDGLARLSANNKVKAQTKEGQAKLKARSQTAGFKNRDVKSYWQTEEGKAKKKAQGEKFKKENNPEFAKKLSKIHKDRLKDPKQRSKFKKTIAKFFNDPLKVAERGKKITLARGSRCQVKQPGKDWQTFDSFGEASRYYNWNLSGDPKTYFPEDGKIKVGNKGKFKGWQTRRIII